VSWEGFSRTSRGPSTTRASTASRFSTCLGRYFEALSLSTDWDSLKEADDELLINSLSMLCPFDPEEKQALLEAPSLSTRRETLVTLLEFALRGGAPEETMQ
jgi:Lon protease-like protein